MRSWVLMLGGLIVWTAHFFALYGIASIFPGKDFAGVLVLGVSLAALLADGVLLRFLIARRTRLADSNLGSSMTDVALIGVIVSLVAIVWQALPAVLL